MRSGVPYKKAKLEEKWDAIVIGSGIGGLSAATMLCRHGGKRVLVFERHYEIGGFTHVFRRSGFEWDVGLHYIGQLQDPNSFIRRIFDDITLNRVQWQAMPRVYDRIFIKNQKFDFVAGLENFRENLKQLFPCELPAIDCYITAVQACNRASRLYYAEQMIPASVAQWIGGWMRAPYLRWARQTTRAVLENLTTNPELIGVLTAQWGDYGLPPGRSSFAIHATVAAHYFDGGSYPIGGASTLATAIVPQIESQGGAVVSCAEVVSILLDEDNKRVVGVRMSDGREFRTAIVLSDAGITNTFERLLPFDLPMKHSLHNRLRQLQPSTAHVALYVGLSKSNASLGLNGTNLWSFPSFDHDRNGEEFKRDFEMPFPSVYLSFPSAKDPDFESRHPGKSTIEVITLLPYEVFAHWEETHWKQRGEEYKTLKEKIAKRLHSELERRVPSVIGNIEHVELSTPLTTRHFMNYKKGEIYGIACTPHRYDLREMGVRTLIRGLYLTGQDSCSPGVAGALVGGIMSASTVLGKNLLSAIAKNRIK